MDDKRCILIVDDDEGTRKSLTLILRRKGYETETAATGQEALEKARERAFNLAFLDIRLPDMAGLDLIALLREMQPQVAVIMITGYASVGTAVQALNAGASGYVIKPVNMDELLAVAREALNKQRLAQEKRRAEAALRQSEERFRQFFESIPEYGYLISPEGIILDVNHAARRALGYKKEELVGKPLKTIYAPESLPKAGQLFDRWRETGQLMDEEMVILTREGERRTVLLSADAVRDLEGQMLHSVSVQKDITERKRAEEALRETRDYLENLLDHASAPIIVWNPAGRITRFNQAFEQLTGYTAEQVIGRELGMLFPETSRDESLGQIARTLSGEHWESVETPILCQDGDTRLVLWNSANIHATDSATLTATIAQGIDITERKQAEQALAAERLLLRTLVDHLPDAIYLKNDACRKTLANPADVRNMGASSEAEALGKTDFDFYPHDLAAAFYADDQSIIRSGRPVLHREEMITLPDGTHGWQLTSKVPLRDSAGQVVGLVGIGHDITERKRVEQALQQRASQLALLNEIGRQVTALLDVDQVLDRAAHLVQERFGFHHVGLFTRADGEDRLVMKARAGEFAPLFPLDHAAILGEGMVGWVGQHGETLLANDVDAEPRYVNPYPERLPTRSELSVPIRIGAAEGRVVGVLDLQSSQLNAFDPDDVTTLETLAGQLAVAINNARLYSQAAQHNRELTLLNRVIAATAAAEGALKPILEVVCRELALAFEVPQAAAALFNKEKTEAVVVAEYLAPGRPPSLGVTIPAVGNPASQHLLTQKTPLVIEDAQTDPRQAPIHDLMRRRGSVSLLLLPLMADGEVVGSLGLDAIEPRAHSTGSGQAFSVEEVNLAWRVAEQVSGVLARARLQEEHRQMEEQFHQAQKMEAVGRLAGGVAHDFNNLLTVIHLSTRLLEKKLRPEDPLWQHVQRIQDAGQRATGLTRQLLAFSRREIVEAKVLDLSQVLGELHKMLQRLIREDIEVTTRLTDDLWPVKIDPTQVEQVVVNLVVNAGDAMPGGGKLTIETANVVLDAAYAAHHLDVEPGEYVMLAVSDNGLGMTAEIKARIFEPFFTTKEKGKGTGLGLATVFGIVKQNKGHIWVYSEPGRGTTFKIYLPRVAAGTRAPSDVPTTGAMPSARGSETLLLVEDESGVRELVTDILAAQGYRVLAAMDGVEALQVARNHEGPIHLLVTDVVMPRMGGKALADQLRSSRPEMQVLYTSGYTDNAIVHHGVLDEGVHFLSKPFELEALARKVRDVLEPGA